MMQPLSAVVPTSMDRPKRIAKRLSHIYPHKPLSVCQATTAHLYFHKDWHALEQAVKAGASGAPFLDDLPANATEIRRRGDQQLRIICEELAEIDYEADYSPPKERPSFDTSAREHQAVGRYHKLLAAEVICELIPTARRSSVKQKYPELTPMSEPSIASALPGQIGTWWSVNVPHQDMVGRVWAGMTLDPNDRIGLLRAGSYWGTLCMHYAHTIDLGMVLGVSFLFASRYATLCMYDSKEVRDAFRVFETAGQSKKVVSEANRQLDELFIAHAGAFLDTYSRDDLPDIFRAQPQAFIKNAETCLKIFSNPRSKRGTWNNR